MARPPLARPQLARPQLAPPQLAPRQPVPERPALRVTTGLTLTATGAILLLAVRARVPFLDLPVTGLILMTAGLTWLWIPVRNKRALARRHFDRVMSYLQWGAGELDEARCSLTDLLAEGKAVPAGVLLAEGGGPASVTGSADSAADG
jgi:hypothetical protein